MPVASLPRVRHRLSRQSAAARCIDAAIHRRRARFYLRHLLPHVSTGKRLVDVGAGDGLLVKMLTDATDAASVRAFDVESRQLGPVPVEVYDGKTLPIDDAGADISLCVTVLHHCTDARRVLSEIRRVTSQRFLLVEDRFNSLPDRLAVLGVHHYLRWVESMPFDRHGFASTTQWCQLLNEAGFAVVETKRLGIAVPWLPVTNTLFICAPG